MMSNVDVQLKAPAETGEREINSKRRAAAEEEETTALVKDAMIERRLTTRTLIMPRWTEVEKNLEFEQV